MEFKTINKELFSFIKNSPTAFHAVDTAVKKLLDSGYKKLSEGESWTIEGGKYFVTRNQSSIIAFEVPNKDYNGFLITASHSDSPCFKVKENGEIKVLDNYTVLNTEGYGGMIMSSWFDRPLSLAGRAIIKSESGIKSKLFNIDRDVLTIPNLAIHLQRDINNGYKYNAQTDMMPLFGGENASLKGFIAGDLGVEIEDIISLETFVYARDEGKTLGFDEDFIQSPRLDDLQCAYASLKAFLDSENNDKVKILCVFDNEEVGSTTKQGADSTFLYDVMKRINLCVKNDEESFFCDVANSFMVSADNAHAVHPNYVGKFDATNKNFLNKGPVIKYNANQKYTTDAVSSAVFKSICENADVPYQVFHNRSDSPGGSTLGNISNSHVSLNTIDIGLPQFAMHSAVETAGAKDTAYMIKALTEFYSIKFIQKSDENFKLNGDTI